jgi:predicted tellurium resistance membrane protein TerC
VGLVAFFALLWIATLGGVSLLWHVWSLVLLVFGVLLSFRFGRAYGRGETLDRHFSKQVHPTVDVHGQAGSTYVLLEPARRGGKVRPESFSPFWWALYSVLVRAPVALGDVVLTLGWRTLGGLGGTGSGALWRGFQMDRVDHPEGGRSPDDETF